MALPFGTLAHITYLRHITVPTTQDPASTPALQTDAFTLNLQDTPVTIISDGGVIASIAILS